MDEDRKGEREHTLIGHMLLILLIPNVVFKPGAPAAVPGFLQLILCGSSVCMCVRPHPRGY